MDVVPQNFDRLRYGYWPHRQLSGDIPSAIQNVDDYNGSDVLNVACTQTGLSASKQRRLVEGWVNELPNVPATTIVFSTKVSQNLFDAACQAPELEALNIKWSSAKSLRSIQAAEKLKAFFLGSSPGIADLRPLASLSNLKYLFVENVLDPVDLEFLRDLGELSEFGLSANRGRKMKVLTLEPIASAAQLEMIWLVSLKIMEGGLKPLHSLQHLTSLRSTFKQDSKEFMELCRAVPSLQYFQPVG